MTVADDLEQEGGGGDLRLHIHHDHHLAVASTRLRSLRDAIFAETEASRPAPRSGKRPRGDAAERRRQAVGNLLANLALLSLGEPDARLVVSLEHPTKSRYRRQDVPPQVFTDAVKGLEAAGLVSCIRGNVRAGERTTIAPRGWLRNRLQGMSLEPGDVVREPGGETIILRQDMGWKRPKVLRDYEDTPETTTMRRDLETINRALAEADIRLDGKRRHDCRLVRIFQVELGEPTHFNGQGRMYRGFWQNLERDKRHLITIDGEPVADLDYRSMFLSLAYGLQGVPMPPGDPYAVPGLEGHREGVKRAVSAMFSRNTPLTDLPEGLEGLFPHGWTGRMLQDAIASKHPAIAPLLCTNLGPRLTRMESDIMVEVLLRLLGRGIVALPCHDGLLVAARWKEAALETMRAVPREAGGMEIGVEEKALRSKDLEAVELTLT